MRVLKKALVVPVSVALVGAGSLTKAAVIYDGQGFESTGTNSFSTQGAASYDTNDHADLYGQGNPFWSYADTDGSTPPSLGTVNNPGHAVTADVETTVTHGGTQAVSLARTSTSVDTRWAPSTFSATYGHPYNPVASGEPIVDIDWDMNVASGNSNSLFGIELNNGTSRIAYVAVDDSGNVDDDHAAAFTQTGTQVTTGTWNHYELQANFATDKYQVFLNNIATPLDTFDFENLNSQFTDASLVSYSGNGGSASGNAYYDNYIISAVPEPTGFAAVMAGCGMLLLRRRRTSGSSN